MASGHLPDLCDLGARLLPTHREVMAWIIGDGLETLSEGLRHDRQVDGRGLAQRPFEAGEVLVLAARIARRRQEQQSHGIRLCGGPLFGGA